MVPADPTPIGPNALPSLRSLYRALTEKKITDIYDACLTPFFGGTPLTLKVAFAVRTLHAKAV